MIQCVAIITNGNCAGISRCLNILGVKCQRLLPHETPTDTYSHIIVADDCCRQIPNWVLTSPALVLTLGRSTRLAVTQLGGDVVFTNSDAVGPVEVTELIEHYQDSQFRLMTDSYRITRIPPGFRITGVTDSNTIATLTDHRKWWCVQYFPDHPRMMDVTVFQRFLARKITG